MYHPPYYIRREVRLAIMITLILGFFIASPLLILYTAGYRFDPGTKSLFSTGVLSVDAVPEDANLYIDDIFINNELPYRKPGLAPNKSYHVRLEKPGYLPWTKEIFVGSNQTGYVQDIELTPDESPVPVILAENDEHIQDIELSPQADSALVAIVHDGVKTLSLYTFETKQLTDITTVDEYTPHFFDWSPYTNHALVEIAEDEQAFTLFLFPADDPSVMGTYTTDHPVHIDYQWNQQKEELPLLYARNETVIEQFSRKERKDVFSTSSSIWYVDADQELWTYEESSRELVEQSDADTETQRISLFQLPTAILWSQDNHLFVQAKDRLLLVDTTAAPEQRVKETVHTQKLWRDRANGMWLAWSPWELWAIASDGTTTLLNRTDGSTTDVQMLNRNMTMLITGQKGLSTFDSRYHIHQRILEQAHIADAVVHEENKTIFFTVEDPQKEYMQLFRRVY